MGAERVSFLMDEHVPSAVTSGLRMRGADVVTVQEAALGETDDEGLLRYAAERGRVMVTQDDDFLGLHAAGVPHSGIAYAPQGTSVGYLFHGLLLIYGAMEPKDMVEHVEYL